MITGRRFVNAGCSGPRYGAIRFVSGVKSIVVLTTEGHHLIMWIDCDLQVVVAQACSHQDRSEPGAACPVQTRNEHEGQGMK